MNYHLIFDNLDLWKNNQENRFKNIDVIDVAYECHTKWKDALSDIETLRHRCNLIQRQIGTIRKNKQVEPPEELNIEYLPTSPCGDQIENIFLDESWKTFGFLQLGKFAKVIKNQIKELEPLAKNLEKERDNNLKKIGNKLHQEVPIAKSEDQNQVIFKRDRALRDAPFNHHQLMNKLGILDMESGSEIAGYRGYFLKNQGVILQMALSRYAIDFAIKNGFSVEMVPTIIQKRHLEKVAQLSEFEETLYCLEDKKCDPGYEQYLIATAEQPLAAKHHNKTYTRKQLPLRACGYSECYRREAGSHGEDTLGIFRVHQFRKVELFSVVAPDQSDDEFHLMTDMVKKFYDSLGLSYQLVLIASGALNNAAHIKVDLEAYFPHSEKFRELVSTTNCTDYQSYQLGCKYDGKEGTTCHMLNSTLMADTRTICCILENYQTSTGVVMPEVLVPYLGFESIDFLE